MKDKDMQNSHDGKNERRGGAKRRTEPDSERHRNKVKQQQAQSKLKGGDDDDQRKEKRETERADLANARSKRFLIMIKEMRRQPKES